LNGKGKKKKKKKKKNLITRFFKNKMQVLRYARNGRDVSDADGGSCKGHRKEIGSCPNAAKIPGFTTEKISNLRASDLVRGAFFEG
jgi:hypothetical protein